MSKSDLNLDIDLDSLIHNSQPTPPDESILAPYNYLQQIPSNNHNVRSKFLHGFNSLYYHIESKEILDEIDAIVSIFHVSSLLIDDIEDDSSFRRGLPTSHIKYGTPLTINCGNSMYFLALQRATTNLPQIYHDHIEPDINMIEMSGKISTILVDEMLNLHHGQGLDIYWRDSFTDIIENDNLPTYNQYLKMVMDKTGGLFRLSIKLLELFSQSFDKPSNIPLANLLGIVYQIRDDYLNLTDSGYSHMKGYAGEDLIEGKLSLPILHCLRNSHDDLINCPVYKILYDFKSSKQRETQSNLIDEAIEFMKLKTLSLPWTHDLLMEYSQRARNIILESKHNDEQPLLLTILNHLSSI